MFRQWAAAAAAVTIVWGCTPEEPAPQGDDPTETDEPTTTPDTDTVPVIDTATSTTGTTGDTGDSTTGIVVDCAALSPTPISTAIVPNARSHHSLAFDANGMLLGWANGNVMAYDYYGAFAVYSPNLGSAEQYDMAPDGNLYAATFSSVVQIQPNGSQTAVGGPTGTYGLKVGPDNKIYAANNSEMVRIDVAAGTQEIYIPPGGGRAPRIMDWSPDLSRMYIGNFGGSVDYVDLDANFNTLGPPQELAPVTASYKDGMAVDVCGNIYVALYDEQALIRITPDGAVSYVYNLPTLDRYGHGIQFGSGIGGWRADALYLPLPYGGDQVSEVVIGVYHRTWQGTVINLP